jgi:hypothetical protein
MLRIGLVAVLLLLLPGCSAGGDPQRAPAVAKAAPGTACLPWESAVRTMQGADPRAAIVYADEGDEARRLLTFVNALPPVSHAKGDRVAVLYEPRSEIFLFVVGQRGCLASVVRIPTEQFARFVGTSI